MKIMIGLAGLCMLPLLSHAQNQPPACTDLHNGTFYFYPKNSADHYFSVRDGEVQREADLTTGDTTVWRVKWLSDCAYSLSFQSSSATVPEKTLAILKKHELVYKIENVGEDYYVFTGHIDKTSSQPFQTDTMWLHEKANVSNNELFTVLSDPGIPRKEHFSDTSKYALLYLYRPGKLTHSLGQFLVYFDDNVIWVARNNSGHLFRILKEGRFQVKSRLFKDEAAVDVDIKFGQTYFVKATTHWGIYKRLYNFKLEMATVPADVGKPEFDGINFR